MNSSFLARVTLATAVIPLIAAVATAAGATRTAEWQTLFDGTNLSAWKIYGEADDAPITWGVEGGVLAWKKGAGNLATKEKFSDFELELEWKISPGGNSGVMFGVNEDSDKPWHSGPELQILDDAKHRDGQNPLTRTGALYSLYPPAVSAAKPVGEWNAMRVKVQGGHVQCWLNGQQTVDAQMNGEDWNARVKKSKFAPFKQFGRGREGRILLQDHNESVWFRNIRVRRL